MEDAMDKMQWRLTSSAIAPSDARSPHPSIVIFDAGGPQDARHALMTGFSDCPQLECLEDAGRHGRPPSPGPTGLGERCPHAAVLASKQVHKAAPVQK